MECLRSWSLVLLMAAVPAFAADVVVPSPSTGSIDGKIALLFWPARFDEARTPLPADDCQVHVAPADSMMGGHLYPCGSWFQPLPGRYLVWLEQRATVSPQTFIVYDYLPFNGLGHMVMMPMRDAGWLRVDAPALPDATIRILSLETTTSDPRAFDRRLAAASAGTSVRVPAGNVVAGIFDASGNATALSKPVKVVAGKTATAAPRAPAANTDIILSLMREGRDARGTCRAAATFGEGAPQPADTVLNAWDRVVAIWYGAHGQGGQLTVECAKAHFDKNVQLESKSVLTIRDRIR
jgi:hypothetical protein